jgi:hypothetical protein
MSSVPLLLLPNSGIVHHSFGFSPSSHLHLPSGGGGCLYYGADGSSASAEKQLDTFSGSHADLGGTLDVTNIYPYGVFLSLQHDSTVSKLRTHSQEYSDTARISEETITKQLNLLNDAYQAANIHLYLVAVTSTVNDTWARVNIVRLQLRRPSSCRDESRALPRWLQYPEPVFPARHHVSARRRTDRRPLPL